MYENDWRTGYRYRDRWLMSSHPLYQVFQEVIERRSLVTYPF